MEHRLKSMRKKRSKETATKSEENIKKMHILVHIKEISSPFSRKTNKTTIEIEICAFSFGMFCLRGFRCCCCNENGI